MRIALILWTISALVLSLPSLGQRDNAPGFYEDLESSELGSGIFWGRVCMHPTSRVRGQPPLWEVEPNYDDLIRNEIFVEILAESREQRIVRAAETALEKYGFVRVADNIYELPGSSLCFLKVYRPESPKGMTFVPFFKSPLERCDVEFSVRYDPIAFERMLVEEFDRLRLTDYTELTPTVFIVENVILPVTCDPGRWRWTR